MTISVMFRGPMLFVSKGRGGPIREIVIPNAFARGCHEDNTTKRKHKKGMLVIDGKEDYVDLSSARKVTFVAADEPDPPTTHANYAGRVLLNDVANTPTDPKDWIRRKTNPAGATTIELIGGEISASLETEILLELPRHNIPTLDPPRRVPILTTWTSKTASEGYYQIDNRPREEITSSMRLFVYNWDVKVPRSKKPTEKDLLRPVTHATMKKPFEDLDMKWVYTLFDPPTTCPTWRDWLRGEPFPVLRTPGYKSVLCGHKMNPPTSTCDGMSYYE